MKILEIVADLQIGGAQRVSANIAKYAPDGTEFTYAVFDRTVGDYEAEIEAKGNRVVHISSPHNSRRFVTDLSRLLNETEYDVVHCHTMYSCGMVMLIAWLHGVPGRISHSHTALDQASGRSRLRKAYKGLMRALIHLFGTDYLSCGVDAGNELYGEHFFQKKGVVIKNGIDTDAYRFSEKNRVAIRRELGLDDRFIIGHVGHYETVKNQAFLIRLMPEIRKQRSDAVLLLYGGGTTKDMLEQEICSLHLEDHARVMGNVRNISEVLSAFDVFAFPSLFEGTPLALLEAQTNGLPCVISDRIPADACVTDLIERMPLTSPELWTERLVDAHRKHAEDYAEVVERNYESIRRSMQELNSVFNKYIRKSE